MDRTYPHGVTSWIDLASPDVGVARTFYGALFGWSFEDRMPPDAPYRYVIATLDGQDVAGLGGPDEGGWATYVAVDDVDTTAQALAARGATLLEGPLDVGPPEHRAGRSAALRDPEGATFHLWQAGRRLGAQVTNAPGTWNFSHLHTADVAAAQDFYGPALGWRFGDAGLGTSFSVAGYGDHLEATVDPDIRTRQEHAPEGFADVVGAFVPLPDDAAPHWRVVFSVADRDAAASGVEELGGAVLATADDEWTRTAEVRDPQGAAFTLSQFAPQGDW